MSGSVYTIFRCHRSGNRWNMGGRTVLEEAQAECRGLAKEPQEWRPVERQRDDGRPGLGLLWSTEMDGALEWFEIVKEIAE